MPHHAPPDSRTPPLIAPEHDGNRDVADDGQEEVSSRRAIERGLVEDPKAMSPQDLTRAPKSPGRLDQEP